MFTVPTVTGAVRHLVRKHNHMGYICCTKHALALGMQMLWFRASTPAYAPDPRLRAVQAKETWSMSDEEKLEAAQRRKEKGNAQFKAGKWAAALEKYKVGCHSPAAYQLHNSCSIACVPGAMPAPHPAWQDWHWVADDNRNWQHTAAL